MLCAQEIVAAKSLQLKGIVGIWPAAAVGDDIQVRNISRGPCQPCARPWCAARFVLRCMFRMQQFLPCVEEAREFHRTSAD